MQLEGNVYETSLWRAALAIAVGTVSGASLVTLFAVLSDLEYFREYGRETDAALLVFTTPLSFGALGSASPPHCRGPYSIIIQKDVGLLLWRSAPFSPLLWPSRSLQKASPC